MMPNMLSVITARDLLGALPSLLGSIIVDIGKLVATGVLLLPAIIIYKRKGKILS